MATRETSWQTIVLQTEPDHTRKSRYVVEYEFSAPGRRSVDDEKTHEQGRRIFKGDEKNRGGYSE